MSSFSVAISCSASRWVVIPAVVTSARKALESTSGPAVAGALLRLLATRTAAESFESATATSPDVLLTGTGGANTIVVNACRATVHGLGGSDTIATKEGTRAVGPVKCRGSARRTQLHGDGGKDVLVGSAGPDLLVGGPGRDSADGKDGRDTCLAERVKRCEKRA